MFRLCCAIGHFEIDSYTGWRQWSPGGRVCNIVVIGNDLTIMIDNVCNNERVLMMVMKALLQMMAVAMLVTLLITTLLKRVKMTKLMMAMILAVIGDVCNIVKGDVDGG